MLTALVANSPGLELALQASRKAKIFVAIVVDPCQDAFVHETLGFGEFRASVWARFVLLLLVDLGH